MSGFYWTGRYIVLERIKDVFRGRGTHWWQAHPLGWGEDRENLPWCRLTWAEMMRLAHHYPGVMRANTHPDGWLRVGFTLDRSAMTYARPWAWPFFRLHHLWFYESWRWCLERAAFRLGIAETVQEGGYYWDNRLVWPWRSRRYCLRLAYTRQVGEHLVEHARNASKWPFA